MKKLNKSKCKFKSKKESPGHTVWKDRQSKTVTKNPIFRNLN